MMTDGKLTLHDVMMASNADYRFGYMKGQDQKVRCSVCEAPLHDKENMCGACEHKATREIVELIGKIEERVRADERQKWEKALKRYEDEEIGVATDCHKHCEQARLDEQEKCNKQLECAVKQAIRDTRECERRRLKCLSCGKYPPTICIECHNEASESSGAAERTDANGQPSVGKQPKVGTPSKAVKTNPEPDKPPCECGHPYEKHGEYLREMLGSKPEHEHPKIGCFQSDDELALSDFCECKRYVPSSKVRRIGNDVWCEKCQGWRLPSWKSKPPDERRCKCRYLQSQ